MDNKANKNGVKSGLNQNQKDLEMKNRQINLKNQGQNPEAEDTTQQRLDEINATRDDLYGKDQSTSKK